MIVTARAGKEMVLATGDKQILEERINCQFQIGRLLDYETRYAIQHFKFGGMPSSDPTIVDGQDAEGVSSPVYRCSLFDTTEQGWDEQTRAAVEAKLENDPSYGGDFVRVDPPVIPAPWPSYDKLRGRGNQTTAELLAAEVRKLELDVDGVLDYEVAHQNRPDVIAALQALLAETPEEPLVAA